MTYLAIDIGGTFTKYALMDEQGQFFEKGKFPTVKDSLPNFLESLCQLTDSFPQVEGLAISSAGIIDSEKGVMHNGGSLSFIENLALAEILEERLQLPVTIENDAKCAALAELWKGSLADCYNAVAMIIGTAVGGAVIIERKILNGHHLLAGEFSYILTDSTDSQNPQKTLALSGGLPALLQSVVERKSLSLNEVTGEAIFNWIELGDGEVLSCLTDYARLLAVQILNLHVIINPERFVIGGGISEQELFISLLNQEISKLMNNYPYPLAIPEIVACDYHNDANLLGALYHFLERQKIGGR